MAEKRPSRLMLPIPVLLLAAAFIVMGRIVPAAPRAELSPADASAWPPPPPPATGEADGCQTRVRVTVGGAAVILTPGTTGLVGPLLPAVCQFNIVMHSGGSDWAAVAPPYVWDRGRAANEGINAPTAGRSVTADSFVVANTGRAVRNPGGGTVLPVLTLRVLPGVPAGTYQFQFAPSGGAPFFQAFDVVAAGRE